MGAQGIVLRPGQGPAWNMSPGRSAELKLLGGATGGSIMMFEGCVPAGTKSTFHLHHDSDEVAYVLSGEVTFKIGDKVAVGSPGTCVSMSRGVPDARKNSGTETGRVLFLDTPARAGGLFEEQQRTHRTIASMNEKKRPSCASVMAGRSLDRRHSRTHLKNSIRTGLTR